MIRAFTAALTLVILTACETVPVEEVPVTMDPVEFSAMFERAEANPSPPSADQALTELLARSDLTEEQRVEATYLRAEKRRTGNFNLPGAVTDYDAFLAARPLDPKAADAKRHLGTAKTRVRNAEQRLAYLQTLRAWFDDSVLMGRVSEAAARYEKSGITPTEAQVYTLREAGYICATGTGKRVHNYGAMPSYVQNLTWCPSEPVS